jgi:hypothetical protein
MNILIIVMSFSNAWTSVNLSHMNVFKIWQILHSSTKATTPNTRTNDKVTAPEIDIR